MGTIFSQDEVHLPVGFYTVKPRKFEVLGTGDSIESSNKRLLLYDLRESCLLIGPICLYKSLCLPENWSKLAQKVI